MAPTSPKWTRTPEIPWHSPVSSSAADVRKTRVAQAPVTGGAWSLTKNRLMTDAGSQSAG
ncbi:hypothetical protein AGR3A_Lc180073 [Agrobacterium tomkonis CFBP 6623]|uniref:Uncharacterized protein n=1 Tax=Agrobacterium tomkonis CFBP 6623 TaxID=1183432 RepID=A0A1S7S1N4_9HYPH|nr:hypothetical protein AGR3A_Lc180073 [Agrobacterium tomkonis CFBP 6623]